MTVLRFFAVILIFFMVSIAWLILGGTIEYRTDDLQKSLSKEVDARWGPSGLAQEAPVLFVEETLITSEGERRRMNPVGDPADSQIAVAFNHENRYMGLLWFSTYTVTFSGTYTVERLNKTPVREEFAFELPPRAPMFENLAVNMDGQTCDISTIKKGNRLTLTIPNDGDRHAITVSYRTQARDRWLYDLAHSRPATPTDGSDPTIDWQTAMVKKFCLTATTNFRDIDYPKGSASPTPEAATDIEGGKKAVWKFENRSTRQQIGIEMPQRLNAGPVAARMALYAPVGLFFFFTVMFTTVLLKKIPLHPMHYLFISAGFFAFHILLAYLVDKISIQYAFWICAATSTFLVVSYMRLVAGAKFAVLDVGLAQLVYLIGFSYAFFWTGWTGLTIVIVAIVTLFVLMQATGRLIWGEIFGGKPKTVPAAPPAPPAPPAR